MSISSKPTYVLGISCFFHDAAAALLKDGVLVAAAQEERFTRRKNDRAFPREAIRFCLAHAGITAADISAVVFYEKPLLKFERVLTGFFRTWPFAWRDFVRAMPSWLQEKLWVAPALRRTIGYRGPVYYSSHHMSHAASAFYPSPFARAAVLTVDGVGEWATASFGRGKDATLTIDHEIHFPHSLGLFYSAVTCFLGFRPDEDEYKVMGLAPYGRPVYVEALAKIFSIRADGSFALQDGAFNGTYATDRVEHDLAAVLGFPSRRAGEPLTQSHKDLAASVQHLTNETMVAMASHVRHVTGEDVLCMAGGVALNCVANAEVMRRAGFRDVWVQPAAGDAGGALGAALWYWHGVRGEPRRAGMTHAQWGPSFSDDAVGEFLAAQGIRAERLPSDDLVARVADLLAANKIVGWFQGRMEWGPRALGGRSILADPRHAENQQRVNRAIKFREDFRPFAPCVPRNRFAEYFDGPQNPFMLMTVRVLRPDAIPAVTHVDGSARVQVVDRASLPLFAALLEAFAARTGVPVLLNTSFNVQGEPIVCTPEDAWRTFLASDLDVLAIGNYLVTKDDYARSARTS